LPSESDIDSKVIKSLLGHKKRYAVNSLSVMGKGDILMLFTDGFTDQRNGELNYTSIRLEKKTKTCQTPVF
jgi:serine phosphatase RsbU (regulator of sigma subunit)